jgi:hypothetical protein
MLQQGVKEEEITQFLWLSLYPVTKNITDGL